MLSARSSFGEFLFGQFMSVDVKGFEMSGDNDQACKCTGQHFLANDEGSAA